MTNPQVESIKSKFEKINGVVNVEVSASKTTTSKYFIIHKENERKIKIRFSSHGEPYRKYGIFIVPRYERVNVVFNIDEIFFNLPSMKFTLGEINKELLNVCKYIETF